MREPSILNFGRIAALGEVVGASSLKFLDVSALKQFDPRGPPPQGVLGAGRG